MRLIRSRLASILTKSTKCIIILMVKSAYFTYYRGNFARNEFCVRCNIIRKEETLYEEDTILLYEFTR